MAKKTAPKKKTRKKLAKKSPKKAAKPYAKYYRLAGPELTTILTYALVTPSLRNRIGYPKGSDSTDVELELQFFSTAKMKALNLKHRKKNRPTDVLSFPAHAVFRTRGVLGDLVICPEVLEAQAKEQGHSAREELRVLLIHGVLHLLGFDHEAGPKAEKLMRKVEAEVLAQFADGGRGLIERVSRGHAGQEHCGHDHAHGESCEH